MKEPRYFVVVFGDPEPDRDPVDSGTYRAGDQYPAFEVGPGDWLLLYCTRGYPQFPMQVPGVGKVLHSNQDEIKYEWKQLQEPVLRAAVLDGFDEKDRLRMEHLGIKANRVFEISKRSFTNAIVDKIDLQ